MQGKFVKNLKISRIFEKIKVWNFLGVGKFKVSCSKFQEKTIFPKIEKIKISKKIEKNRNVLRNF